MKTKEIANIFGVPPSTLGEWKKSNHPKKPLANLLVAIDKHTALSILKNNEPPQMLLATVNASIGNSKNHLKPQTIKKILSGDVPQNLIENYALNIIKTEADSQEIEAFAKFYNIPQRKVNKVVYGGR